MAIVNANISDYVVENYLEDQNNYVTGAALFSASFSASLIELNLVSGSLSDYIEDGVDYVEPGFVIQGPTAQFTQQTTADISILVEGSADLTSSFVVSDIDAGITKTGVVDIATEFSTSIKGGFLLSGSLTNGDSVVGSFDQSTTATVSFGFLVGLYSAFSADNTVASVSQQATVSSSASFAVPDITSGVTVNAVSTIASEFTQTTTAINSIPITLSFGAVVTQSDLDAINTIAATFTVNSALQATVLARANLDGDIDFDIVASQQTTATTLVNGTPDTVNTAFTQTTGSDLFRNGSADLASAFTTSITANNTTGIEDEFSSAFAMPEFDPTVYLFIEITNLSFNSAFAQSVTASNQVGLSATEGDDYTWDDTTSGWLNWPRNIWGFEGLHFPGDFSTVYNNNLIVGTVGDIALDTEFSQNTIPLLTKSSPVAISTAFNSTIKGGYALTSTSDISTAFSQTLTSENLIGAVSDQTGEFTLVADGIKVISAAADFTSSFSMTPSAEVLQLVTIDMELFATQVTIGEDLDLAGVDLISEFSQSTVANNIIGAELNISGVFSDSTLSINFKNALIDITSAFAQTTNSEILAQAGAEFVSTATQLADTRVLIRAELEISAFATQLTVGKELTPDPYRKLSAHSETRILNVYSEPRTLTVNSETRVEKINTPAYNSTYTRRVA